MERRVRRKNYQPAEETGCFRRLGQRAFYHGRGLFQSGAGSFHQTVRKRLYLQRLQNHQLVSGMSDLYFWRRGRAWGPGRIFLAHQLSGSGRRRKIRRNRNHTSGNPFRRYCSRGKSGRRALQRPGRQNAEAAADRERNSGCGRRICRQRIRNRLCEDYSGPWPQWLWGRKETQPSGNQCHERWRYHQWTGRQIRRYGPLRSQKGHGRGLKGAGTSGESSSSFP